MVKNDETLGKEPPAEEEESMPLASTHNLQGPSKSNIISKLGGGGQVNTTQKQSLVSSAPI